MASVQELLLAAQAKQKPQLGSQLAQLINAASSGYTEGNNLRNVKSEADLRRAEIIKKLVETQQIQQEADAQIQLQKQKAQEEIGIQSEQNIRSGQAGIANPTEIPTPAGKFKTVWNTNEKGQLSKVQTRESPKTVETPTGYRSTANGNLEFIPGGPADPANKAASTKAPPGFRWTPEGNLETIPGGPTDIKAQLKAEKDKLAQADMQDKSTRLISHIDEALTKVGSSSAGAGALLKNVPLTKAKNLSADLENIKAMLGIEQLAALKAASPTGASGFGALSDRELNVITSAVANLDQSQDPGQLRKNLTEIKTHYQNLLKLQQGVNPYENGGSSDNPATPNSKSTIQTINSQAEYDALPSGATYLDSHGTKATKK